MNPLRLPGPVARPVAQPAWKDTVREQALAADPCGRALRARPVCPRAGRVPSVPSLLAHSTRAAALPRGAEPCCRPLRTGVVRRPIARRKDGKKRTICLSAASSVGQTSPPCAHVRMFAVEGAGRFSSSTAKIGLTTATGMVQSAGLAVSLPEARLRDSAGLVRPLAGACPAF